MTLNRSPDRMTGPISLAFSKPYDAGREPTRYRARPRVLGVTA
jgi:hypothetical protein